MATKTKRKSLPPSVRPLPRIPTDPKRYVTTEEYSQLCDVVERARQHWPVDSHTKDPFCHTSNYARGAANRVLDILGVSMPSILDELEEAVGPDPRAQARYLRSLAAYQEHCARPAR